MKKSKFNFLLSLLALGIFSYLLWVQSNYKISVDFNSKIPEGYNSLGIDVSHHQGIIDWNKLLDSTIVKPKINFVYIKVTEGNDHLDSQWEYNRKSLLELGVNHGAYHFFQSKKLPAPQAEHFLNHWKPSENELPPVLDVEIEGFDDEDLRHKVKRWVTIVEKQSGMRPIIYTSLHFYQKKFKGHFPNHKFWIASYSRNPRIERDPAILHWQFTEGATLPYHRTLVDLNVSKLNFRD